MKINKILIAALLMASAVTSMFGFYRGGYGGRYGHGRGYYGRPGFGFGFNIGGPRRYGYPYPPPPQTIIVEKPVYIQQPAPQQVIQQPATPDEADMYATQEQSSDETENVS